MKLTFLGTGTSFGVPVVGCSCIVCRSGDPRDKRTRVGAVVEVGHTRLLIDTIDEHEAQKYLRVPMTVESLELVPAA